MESPPARIPWQSAAVIGITDETKRAKTFRLRLDEATPYLAGQHYVIRLTAPDGYTAMRSYSIASAPDGSPELEFTVERLDDGEVSTYLHDVVQPGDRLEVRGPIGRWFVWDGETPSLLIGGGSGVVPLMAMLRLARRLRVPELLRVIVSVRSPGDLYYAAEIAGPETTVIYTRETPPSATRAPARLRRDDVSPAVLPDGLAFVCGSAGFADTATDLLQSLGVAAERIRVERFGPSG